MVRPVKKQRYLSFAILAMACLGLSGCITFGPGSSGLAGHTKLKPGATRTVRTTAYTHTESDHRRYGARNALGTRLQSGKINSAASDWSVFPVGTVFKILETGKTYQIDDYGSALVGTSTIDLYSTTRREMNAWGVRTVRIQIVKWGSPHYSLAILRPRSKHSHVRKMVHDLEAIVARTPAPSRPTNLLDPDLLAL